jgi:hypothetical protein
LNLTSFSRYQELSFIPIFSLDKNIGWPYIPNHLLIWLSGPTPSPFDSPEVGSAGNLRRKHMAKTFSWKDEPELMADLLRAQNHPANIGQDHMSFAGMCSSRDELEMHIARLEIRAQNWDQDVEYGVRRAA